MSPIKFYDMIGSPPCHAVRLTAKAIGLEMDRVVFDAYQEEFLDPEFVKLNPQHCVPTIVDDDLTLAESRAICAYIATKYGDGSLYPSDIKERAKIDRMLQFDLGSLYARFGEYAFKIYEGETELFPARLEKLHHVLGIFNTMLEGHTFAVGDQVTIADHTIAASLSSMEATGIDIKRHQNVCNYLRRLEKTLPGYKEIMTVGAKACGEFLKKTFPN